MLSGVRKAHREVGVGDAVEMTASQARSVALAAQRFGRRPARGSQAGAEVVQAGASELGRTAAALGAVQIDAVNVLTRSHYLAFYSRLGPYEAGVLDSLAYRNRRLFEYWGHAASLVPIGMYPALRWRMEDYARSRHYAAFRERMGQERPGYLDALLEEIAERGPLAWTELSDPARWQHLPPRLARYADSTLAWHRRSDGKSALEWLYGTGTLAVAERRGFEPRYDLAERVIPREVISAPALPRPEAHSALVLTAARALGVATVSDLADYFRLSAAETRACARQLAEDGRLRPAVVAGWKHGAYLDPDFDAATASARALLSPFDSLIWQRDRSERLFGYRHLLELYVPAAKRRYGYYVLPFLLGDTIVARVDLKAARATATLQVLAAYLEPGAPPGQTAAELAAELRSLADWLSLDSIQVSGRGDLAARLRGAIPGSVG
jgi:uncharacterized protein